jgi:hypothetical protein
MANLTQAPKKLTPIKLAHGMRLRNGQMIGSSQTIATAGAAKSRRRSKPDLSDARAPQAMT